MPIGELAGISDLITSQPPDITTVDFVMVIIPQVGQPLLDHLSRACKPDHFSKRMAVNKTRCTVQLLQVVRALASLHVELLETGRFPQACLKKFQLTQCIAAQESAMALIINPKSSCIDSSAAGVGVRGDHHISPEGL